MSSSGLIAELDPAVERMVNTLDSNHIFKALSGRKGLLLAVSGGRDSTALMVLASRWKRENRPPCAMMVATVDHGLRPEAESETHMVAENARSLDLDCRILKTAINREDGEPDDIGNIQARARQARYRCLADTAIECGFDTIVTAHHREDQAETFLLRLARGSGVYGLGAMQGFSRLFGVEHGDIALARPLLSVGRADLESLVEECGLSWVDDPSNEDRAFARIRIRSVAPVLAEPGLTADRLAETAARLQRAGEALDHYVSAHLKSNVAFDDFGAAVVDTDPFLDAPPETALRALGRLLQAVGGSEYTPRMDRLEGLMSALREALSNSASMRRTLNGCVADLRTSELRLYREWGRSGLAHSKVKPGTRAVWDRRFRVEIPSDMRGESVIGPLGAQRTLFRGLAKPAILQTIPALYRDGEIVAVPAFIGKENAGQLRQFGCQNVVVERLINPRIIQPGTNDENSC